MHGYYKAFSAYSRGRILCLTGIVLVAGIFEGLGISIIIPLLNHSKVSESQDRYTQIVYELMGYAGVEISIRNILFLLVGLFIIKAIFVVSQGAYSAHLMTDFGSEMKKRFCQKYARVSYEYFINRNAGYFNNIITTEVDIALSGLNNYIQVIICIIYISIYLISAFLLNPVLTSLVIMVAGIFFLSLRVVNKYIRKLSFFITRLNAEIQSLTIQLIHNYKYLKATNGFAPVLKQAFHKIDLHRTYQFRIQFINSIPSSFVEVVSILFLSLLVWYYMEIQHKPIGAVIILLVFFWRALNRVLNFQNYWQRFCSYAGAINIVETANQELDRYQERWGSKKIHDFKDGIHLENIHFSFGDKKIIDTVSISIPKGKIIGIVGPSGSGKTTLLDIIVGMLRPQSGQVKIDNSRYGELDIHSFRKIIGYVTQDPVIFDDSVANNISFWSPGKSGPDNEGKIRQAAALAYCLDFIDENKSGFDAIIGDRGVKLSGGQRQRIAIAREIYKNPKLIIFDEATSALDTESERFIQNSILKLKGKFTLVIIAHRLSTIRQCDIIYVLSRGKVVEEGTFEELTLKENGLFKRMCDEQQL